MTTRRLSLWLGIALLVTVLDQASKHLAEHLLSYQVPVPVTPFFNWFLSYNTGAAFSFLHDAGGWQRWFFIGLALFISVVLIVWLRRLPASARWQALALALILGGALGNVIDRVWLGHVIDFIQLYYDRWYWPTFNIADSAITAGVVILIADSLFGGRRGEHES